MIPYLLILTATLVHYGESAMMKIYNKKFTSGGFMFISVVSLFSALFFLFKYLIFDTVKTDFTPRSFPTP